MAAGPCPRNAEGTGGREGLGLGPRGGPCLPPYGGPPIPGPFTSVSGELPVPPPRLRPCPVLPEPCSGDVPEVELSSLLREPLPRYTLRADTVFGYDHEDWLRAPPGPPGPAAPLTPRQMEETLRYFRECGVRAAPALIAANGITGTG
ncbi:trafficking kinesin-binding protein 1-like [Neopsephotus bourkii]|uniref:trafficking kinesin-binding protein 1-like n=1 Tax=Neopsephotus bourkii TaxID=309878 RepID=UPI002AA575EA|nr:trafficking kinesin-binding protein 1-like [Neopsephotus bourkii]